MKITGDVTNEINGQSSAKGFSFDAGVSTEEITTKIDSVSSQTNAASLSITAKVVSLTAVAAIIGFSIDTIIFDPNDFVNSCFGGGYWVEDYPYSETDAWVE